jgi:hypothetical protein
MITVLRPFMNVGRLWVIWAKENTMSTGWFVFAVVGSMVMLSGFVVAIAILKAAWAQREREALTSSDLRALEESAVVLIEQLKSEIDERTSDLDKKTIELRMLIQQADMKLATIQRLIASSHSTDARVGVDLPEIARDPRDREIADLAAKGADCAEIARSSGMGCAEVKLMLHLANMESN